MSQRKQHSFATPPVSPYGSVSDRTSDRRPWEILLFGDLTEHQGELLNRLLDVPPRSSGILYFDSCGGSVYTGIALATLMKSRGLTATGIVISECSSAALLPFAACRRRFVSPQSTLLFHPMRWQSEEDVRLEEAAEWARHFRELEGDLDKLLCRLLPVDPEKLHLWTRPGRFVNGREIVEAGLAELLDPFTTPDVWDIIRRSTSTN